jgi:hypothetical protein
MKTLWKEWRQQRGLVVCGACAGIIWPLIEMASNYATRKVWKTDLGSGIVAGGGAAFAVFLAMATGHADLRRGIDTFWQTRPVRIGRIFLVKLVVAMGLLAGTFALVMVPEILTAIRGTNEGPYLAWTVFWTTWPMAVLLFGAGLFFVALIRDMAKAAFVTVWFGLLVYFLPLFFNGLRPLNAIESIFKYYQAEWSLKESIAAIRTAWSLEGLSLTQRIQWILSGHHLHIHSDFLALVGISFGGALAFTLLAVQAVKRNWRWQPGQKTIVWTLGASAALIFAITLFQVRSDLQPATHKDGQTLVNPMPLDWVEPPLPQAVKDRGNRLFRGSTSGRIEHGAYLYVLSLAYEADHKLSYKEWERPVYRHLVLDTYRFPSNQNASRLCCGGLVIGSMTEMERQGIGWPIRGSYVWGHHLYVASLSKVGQSKTCVATLDISNPEQPRLVGTIDIPGVGYYGSSFIGRGDQAYILGSDQWTVLSLRQPDQPVVAAQWTSTSARGDLPPQLPRHLRELPSPHLPYGLDSLVAGDRLLCTDGSALVMVDLSEPNDPVLVYHEDLRAIDPGGYAQISALAMDKDYLYLSTQQGLIVRRLIRHADGHWSSERIGYRAATPLERLSGRNVSGIMLCESHLIESDGNFGLLVYDVSDPTRPRRVMHSDLYSDGIGIWNGLLYSVGYAGQINLFDLPVRAQAH